MTGSPLHPPRSTYWRSITLICVGVTVEFDSAAASVELHTCHGLQSSSHSRQRRSLSGFFECASGSRGLMSQRRSSASAAASASFDHMPADGASTRLAPPSGVNAALRL